MTRARRCVAIASAFAALLASPVARAQRTELLPPAHRTFESPQHWAFELRFGPYTPNVDSDPALHGATPYHDVFGTTPRLLVGAEFDWQALRIPHFGSIGPGLGASYTTMSADAQFSKPHCSPGGTCTSQSGEQTTLAIYPFYAVAVLRADVLWKDIGIPFVPYAKAGVGMALWRASNAAGTSSADGVAGKGHSFGSHFALGVGLNLNAFDPYAAKNFDNYVGVNGTYLFAEWMRADLSGLGQQSVLRVGSTTWSAGLAFEF